MTTIATYKGHDVEILEETLQIAFGRNRQMAYIQILDGAQILGTPGMWGGCEQSRGWVYSESLHNRCVEEIPDDLPIPADPGVDEVIEVYESMYAHVNDMRAGVA